MVVFKTKKVMCIEEAWSSQVVEIYITLKYSMKLFLRLYYLPVIKCREMSKFLLFLNNS